MTRLGLLPLEIESGRWHGLPREQRLCSFGCGTIGDTNHFLHGCTHIAGKQIDSLNRYATLRNAAANPLRYWRNTARTLECRWRERAQKMRRESNEPKNPADAREDVLAKEIDAAAMQQISPDDIRKYFKAA